MSSNRWVIFSTYDLEGMADGPSVEQLRSYRDAGFEILLVDTSPFLTESRRSDWQASANAWFHRENVGYDFGSYKFGMAFLLEKRSISIDDLDLILTNDSCFGPFFPITNLVSEFDRLPADPQVICGVTDSFEEGRHHIQSYWVYFRAGASRHAAAFLKAMPTAQGREEAIRHGELGLAAYLESAGCRLVVSCPLEQTIALLARQRGVALSMIELLLRRLLKRWKYGREADAQCLRFLLNRPHNMGFINPSLLFGVQHYKKVLSPFVKKSLLRDNVYGLPGLPTLQTTRGLQNSDVRRILDHPG